jgi:hypothetical protein
VEGRMLSSHSRSEPLRITRSKCSRLARSSTRSRKPLSQASRRRRTAQSTPFGEGNGSGKMAAGSRGSRPWLADRGPRIPGASLASPCRPRLESRRGPRSKPSGCATPPPLIGLPQDSPFLIILQGTEQVAATEVCRRLGSVFRLNIRRLAQTVLFPS